MGVLSDLVPGTEADVQAIGESEVPSREFGGIDVKGIDNVKLGTLHEILTGQDFEALLPQYDPVYEGSEEGPWVFRVPDELTTALALLTSSERIGVAERWGATEEFELEGWPSLVVASTRDTVCELARETKASERSLFLWMSL